MSIKISKLYLSNEVYLTSQTSSSYEIEQLSNSISRQLSSKLDIYIGGSISGNVDIVDANLSINTFENIYDVADKQSLAEKISNKQDKILSVQPGIITTGIYASQHIYDGIYLSTGTGSNPKRLYYPNITADATIATIGDISSQLSNQLSNYLDKRIDAENTISSYNEFTNSSTFFELEDGPQIGFNVDRNVDIQIGGKYYIMPDTNLGPGYGILSNELSVVRGEGSDQLTAELIATRGWPNLVTKTNGGSITADVGIVQHNLNILSGNYIQTSTPDAVVNYASKNAFLQADVDPKYGNSYTGTKAFCVLGLSTATNQIKLSGDIRVLKDIADGRLSVGDMPVDIGKSRSMRNVFGKDTFKEGDLVTDGTSMSAAMFSLTLDNRAASMAFHLSAVDTDTGIVTLNESLKDADGFDALDGRPQSFFEDLWLNDDNAFYLIGFPELGNANVPNNFGQFASGGSVRAIGRQTHAEGRDSIADVRYAYVEGSHCAAAHMATHAEGFRTVANKRYSHSEGEVTKADGRAAHAEGKYTLASGDSSHVEGLSAVASAEAAHAEGRLTEASGVNSHAQGKSTIASGEQSCAFGLSTKSKGKNAFTAGYMSEASKWADNAFVIGRYSMADAYNGSNSFVWQGISNGASYYNSNSKGSFNVNPQNGLSGFYIGEDNFIQCVLSAVQSMDETQIHDLKTVLGLL